MDRVTPTQSESNPMDAREAAIARIRAEELDRQEAILYWHEVEKANDKMAFFEVCQRRGVALVAEWLVQYAEANR